MLRKRGSRFRSKVTGTQSAVGRKPSEDSISLGPLLLLPFLGLGQRQWRFLAEVSKVELETLSGIQRMKGWTSGRLCPQQDAWVITPCSSQLLAR